MLQRHLLYALLCCWPFFSAAQDLESFGKQEPFRLSGSMGLMLNAYDTDRENPRYDPFSYTLTANPTISIYGFSVPFNIVYSERERSFRQPFNRFGAQPTYKWIKLHLGFSNTYFSNYSLASRTFLGGGLELTPGKFRIGAVYGRFNRSIELPDNNNLYIEPSFDRWGYAAKLGFGSPTNYLDLVFFKGEDRYDQSLSDSLATSANPPAENLILGLKTSQLLFKRLTFDMDVAASAWSSNLLSSQVEAGEFADVQILEQLFTPRYATRLSLAGEAGLGVNFNRWGLNVRYRRIDPEYQSMAAFTFLTDIEEVTVNPNLVLAGGKLALSGSIGLQRNNLYDTRLQNSERRIGAINANIAPSRAFNASISYSNFKVDVQAVSEELLSDSFDIVQVAEQLNANLNFFFGDKERRSSLHLTGYGSRFEDVSAFQLLAPVSRLLGGRLSFRKKWKASGFTFSLHTNYSRFNAEPTITDRYGGGLRLRKELNDRLQLTANGDYRINQRNSQADGTSIAARLRLRYPPADRHSFRLATSWTNRSYGISGRQDFTELRATLRYGFSF